jgi:hypothetical protein
VAGVFAAALGAADRADVAVDVARAGFFTVPRAPEAFAFEVAFAVVFLVVDVFFVADAFLAPVDFLVVAKEPP